MNDVETRMADLRPLIESASPSATAARILKASKDAGTNDWKTWEASTDQWDTDRSYWRRPKDGPLK